MTMKNLLTTTALFILLVSLASGVYGQALTFEAREFSNGNAYAGEWRGGKRTGQMGRLV
jgi:hypothetical protein